MIKVWGITNKGVIRSQNQDSYYLKSYGENGITVAVVCDGMGGARAGNVASQLAVTTVAEYLEDQTQEELLRCPDKHLTYAAELANQVIYDRSADDADCYGMGTTMVAAMVRNNQALILNIGDSRAYRMGRGGIVKITRDHSLVEDMVRRGEITPEQARQHPRKNLITRALGSEPTACVDLYDLVLEPGDFLLLCSDGLSNMLTDQEMLHEVMEGGAPDTCCERLLQAALERGAPDNVTAVLISILS